MESSLHTGMILLKGMKSLHKRNGDDGVFIDGGCKHILVSLNSKTVLNLMAIVDTKRGS